MVFIQSHTYKTILKHKFHLITAGHLRWRKWLYCTHYGGREILWIPLHNIGIKSGYKIFCIKTSGTESQPHMNGRWNNTAGTILANQKVQLH